MQDPAAAIDIRPRPAPVLSEISRRELYFFNLFRVIQAVIIGALLLSPPDLGWIKLDHPLLGRACAMVYLVLAGYALLQTERWRHELQFKVALALLLDICATTVAMFSLTNP